MKNFILLLAALTFLASKMQGQTVTDIDGNKYNTVKIGKQIWTHENLKVTHFRNGDPIPNVADSIQWCNLKSAAYCNYNNDSTYVADYGRLYNWYVVNDARNIAPVGWHVPIYSDWDSLQVFVGYDLVAGGNLKEIGYTHWMIPNTGASDESEFTALPGGQRCDASNFGMFADLTMQGFWWSSEMMDTVYPWGVNISYDSEGMTNWAASTRTFGFSIRLIKDVATDIADVDIKESFDIYPNPAHDRIVVTSSYDKTVKMAIYNLFGNLMMLQDMNSNRNTVDISALSSGMYVVKLSTADWSEQRKLVKK